MKKRQKIIIVAGARPNFMKIAPLMQEFKKYRRHFNVHLVHTGQHYDFLMSEVFFQNLGIPIPKTYLDVGSSSHALQTANIMVAFEKLVKKLKPDLVMVVGDVNSTMACSLVASKMNIRIAHVEAGLRSFDREMPEEINRIVTDSLSDYLFATEDCAVQNLKREGINAKKVFFVGNVMIDTLYAHMNDIDKSMIIKNFDITPKSYGILTLHRPNNVDSPKAVSEIFVILTKLCRDTKIIFPMHPRTRKMFENNGFWKRFRDLENLKIIEPLGYIDFIKLVKESLFVLTDSGGIQEETTVLKIPCLTMRDNTERPVTILEGTNYLVGRDKNKIFKHIKLILNGRIKYGKIPRLWDGKAAKRIMRVLLRIK